MQQTLELFDERTAQRERILELLKKNNFVKTSTLRIIAYQYNARIFELRQIGYIIESCRENNICGFKYIGKVV